MSSAHYAKCHSAKWCFGACHLLNMLNVILTLVIICTLFCSVPLCGMSSQDYAECHSSKCCIAEWHCAKSILVNAFWQMSEWHWSSCECNSVECHYVECLHILMLSVILLSVLLQNVVLLCYMLFCWIFLANYAECHSAACHFGKFDSVLCHYVECFASTWWLSLCWLHYS